MGKYGKKNEINLDPLAYNIGLLGESGIGKSTLMKEVCEKLAGDEGYIAFDIGKEDGHSAIEGIVSEPIEDWAKFVEVTDDIIENKEEDYPHLKVVIIDTYDELCLLAEKEAIRLWNKDHPDNRAKSINSAWGGFGRGLDKTIEIILDRLWELKKVGVNFIIVAHTKKKDVDDVMSEEQYSILTSNVSQKYFTAIKTKLHFLGLAYVDRQIVKEKSSKKDKEGNFIMKGKIAGESRVINFRDDTYSVDSKSRFADIVDKIPLDADAFIDALTEAIKKEQSKSGETYEAAKKKQEKSAEKAHKDAAEYSRQRKAGHVDLDANEECFMIIKEKFPDADDSVKEKVKEIMAEYNIPNFKTVETLSTEGLQKIVEVLS